MSVRYIIIVRSINRKEVSKMTERGRPKSDNPKNRKLTVRMTDEEYAKVSDIAIKHGLTKSEAVKKGIDLLSKQK